jgi:hypothetical protein
MSYLDLTVLEDFQADQATNEKRIAKYGMIDLVKDSTPAVDYIPPSVQEKLNTMSASRDAQIPVIKDQTVTVVSTPGFEFIPENLAETANYFFVPFDVFTGMRIFPGSFENNQLDIESYRDKVLSNILQAAAVAIDDLAEVKLLERKTQVLDFTTQVSLGDGSFDFNAGTDTLEISKSAIKDTMFANLEALMAANKLGGDYRIVTNPAGLNVIETEAAKFGPGNQKDLKWTQSVIPMDRRYESHQLAPGVNAFNGFFVRDGAIGMYENYPFDFRKGTNLGGVKQWSISNVELPFTRMRANVYINKEATEATSLISPKTDSNLIMTTFEEMALWFRGYFVYRYNSDLSTRANDIVKIAGLTTNPGE